MGNSAGLALENAQMHQQILEKQRIEQDLATAWTIQEGFLVKEWPEVRECHNITGAIEYLLRIETEDLAAYKHFHTEVLGMLPQVHSITTYVLMDSPKDERA